MTPRSLLRSLGPLMGLAGTWLFFAALAGGPFRSIENHQLMLLQTTVVGAAAVGATLIIASGGIDLSVGSTIALVVMVVALLLKAGMPPLGSAMGGVVAGMVCGLAIGATVIGHVGRVGAVFAVAAVAWWGSSRWGVPAGIGVGALVGGVVLLLNERFVGRLPLSPFIVTLGMWGAIRGLAKGLGDNQPVYPTDTGWLPALTATPQSGIGSFLPPAVWVLAALALAMGGLLKYTVLGRRALAVGSNVVAARLCGVPVNRVKLRVYILGVGCAGVAGVIQFAYLNIGDPTTATGYELKAIAAVVIGGASLSGGAGSVTGTLIGALIMTVVDNGCTKLGLDNWVQEIVTGAIIVIAVAIDRARHPRED